MNSTTSASACVTTTEASLAARSGRTIRLEDVSSHLLCPLCGGYFIDATTIVECLHTFCRSCIMRHLETSSYCPALTCDVMIHRTKGSVSLRLDTCIQNIVYKTVPGLFAAEMRKRREFYGDMPSSSDAHLPCIMRGLEEDSDVRFFSPEDLIDVRVQYAAQSPGDIVPVRYLRCPASLPISVLKRFLQQKYRLISDSLSMDIIHGRKLIPDDIRLLDVCYLVHWNKKCLKLVFRLTRKISATKRTVPEDSGKVEPSLKAPKLSASVLKLADPPKKKGFFKKKSCKVDETSGKHQLSKTAKVKNVKDEVTAPSSLKASVPAGNGPSVKPIKSPTFNRSVPNTVNRTDDTSSISSAKPNKFFKSNASGRASLKHTDSPLRETEKMTCIKRDGIPRTSQSATKNRFKMIEEVKASISSSKNSAITASEVSSKTGKQEGGGASTSPSTIRHIQRQLEKLDGDASSVSSSRSGSPFEVDRRDVSASAVSGKNTSNTKCSLSSASGFKQEFVKVPDTASGATSSSSVPARVVGQVSGKRQLPAIAGKPTAKRVDCCVQTDPVRKTAVVKKLAFTPSCPIPPMTSTPNSSASITSGAANKVVLPTKNDSKDFATKMGDVKPISAMKTLSVTGQIVNDLRKSCAPVNTDKSAAVSKAKSAQSAFTQSKESKTVFLVSSGGGSKATTSNKIQSIVDNLATKRFGGSQSTAVSSANTSASVARNTTTKNSIINGSATSTSSTTSDRAGGKSSSFSAAPSLKQSMAPVSHPSQLPSSQQARNGRVCETPVSASAFSGVDLQKFCSNNPIRHLVGLSRLQENSRIFSGGANGSSSASSARPVFPVPPLPQRPKSQYVRSIPNPSLLQRSSSSALLDLNASASTEERRHQHQLKKTSPTAGEMAPPDLAVTPISTATASSSPTTVASPSADIRSLTRQLNDAGTTITIASSLRQ